jgi:hypothetical protein
MEHANERIVKLFLESKGFLVKTGHPVKIKENLFLEADIIAVRPVPREERDGMPDKIIGEVKSWQIGPQHFKMTSKSKLKRDSFKYLNNEEYRKIFRKEVEKKFGRGFRFAVFASPPMPKHEQMMSSFFKKNRIYYIDHVVLLTEFIKAINEKTYSNDPELQALRLLKKYKFFNKL